MGLVQITLRCGPALGMMPWTEVSGSFRQADEALVILLAGPEAGSISTSPHSMELLCAKLLLERWT